jgi:hypothetical protein
MAVRAFDTPKEPDLFLPNVFEDIRSFRLEEMTRYWVEVQQALYDRAQVNLVGVVTVNGETLTPRQCFEMLAYTDHLHFDADREAQARTMGPVIWELVRMHGALYSGSIANVAIVLRSLARDDPATAHLFVARDAGKISAVEWLQAKTEGQTVE